MLMVCLRSGTAFTIRFGWQVRSKIEYMCILANKLHPGMVLCKSGVCMMLCWWKCGSVVSSVVHDSLERVGLAASVN